MRIAIIVLSAFLLAACTSTAPLTEAPEVKKQPKVQKEASSAKKEFSLVHTRLKVQFDFQNRQMPAEAAITLRPYFYPQNVLALNAKGMLVKNVSLGNDRKNLDHVYRNDSLIITLNQTYQRDEEFTVYINYVARPEELNVSGSAAIHSNKGLYFINHDGSKSYRPRQVWTQGETEASSVWFPTIDAPNQKTTVEIFITVDTSLTTLSNGILISSELHDNGTRTDHWKQSLPHAPYLTMMAIGKFSVVKDEWNGKEVSYYVEPYYAPYARKIFGATPEMIGFFSKLLKFEYPWEKYSQVVVRDYVSGAMENTTATLHGEFMQLTDRELLDFTGEEYISHELFHQWFGNVVTCESWSHVPLNESFASYGEYLWNEYKHGREQADYHLQREWNAYLQESKRKQVNLIRYDYDKPEDMFDRHSYEKGSNILHMLRKYTGDEAFFSALNLYLTKNKFQAAEIHHLRLAFEEITGEDMNWFFDQWFYASGHPELDISYFWNESLKQTEVTISQLQSLEKMPLYRLPMKVDVYEGGSYKRYNIDLNKEVRQFNFPSEKKPDLVNIDAEKSIPCIKTDHHSQEEWIFMFKNARVYLDKAESITALSRNYSYPSPAADMILDALRDKHWNIRYFALRNLEPIINGGKDLRQTLNNMALNDENSVVRFAALNVLTGSYPEDDYTSLLDRAIKDSSYSVAGTALAAYCAMDSVKGLALAKQMEDIHAKFLNEALVSVYTLYGSDEQAPYLNSIILNASSYDRNSAITLYNSFLKKCKEDSTILSGINTIREVALEEQLWFARYSAIKVLSDLRQHYKASGNKMAVQRIEEVIGEVNLAEQDDRVKKAIKNL